MTGDPPATPLATRPPVEVGKGVEASAPLPRLYLANLTALVATGVLVCGWLLYHTESFQIVGGLLGLGGVFAWVAFVLGLLTEQRKEQMQALFEDQLLLRRRTMIACGLAVAGLTVLTSMSGTIVLDAEAEAVNRVASGARPGVSEPTTRTRIAAHSVRRLWFLTPFGGTTLRLKLNGLPGIATELKPPFRTHLSVPSGLFGQPLLLVRLGAVLSGEAAGSPDAYELHLSLDGEMTVLHPYAGQSVWIGTEDDVPIPVAFVQRWREGITNTLLRSGGTPETLTQRLAAVEPLITRWATPRAVFSDVVLQPDQQATIEFVHRVDKEVLVRTTAVVCPASPGLTIQEVILQ